MSGDERRYRDGFFTVGDGLKLHYRDYAGAPDRHPLLCLPGLTRNARDFAHLAERHSPQFRVIALEFRGRGLSDYDPLPARYNPLVYARDAIELLDGLGIPQAVFVGTSLGGLVTMTTGALAPQRIAAAILNDVGPELGQVGIDRILNYVGRGQRFATWEQAAAAIAAVQGNAFPDYGPAQWLATAHRNCRQDGDAIVFDYDMAIADAFVSAGPTPTIDMWPLFAALALKPLLVVRGELSELLGTETFARMRLAAPQAKFVEVPRVGHAPMLDEPEAMAAIDAFLGALPA